MLQLRDVHVTFHPGTASEQRALDGLDLRVEPGEFVTVVGANGSGKSTLLDVVAGAVRPDRGAIEIGGKDVTDLSEHRRATWVARVFDDPSAGTAGALDIADNLAFALRRGRGRGLRPATTTPRSSALRVALAPLGLGLEHRLDEPVALLSAGQRQSLTMVMAALTRPDVLLLDEHLAALDPGTARRVRELTVQLARRLGCVTLMVTHRMRDAIELGDRLLVLRRGRLVADFADTQRLHPDDLARLVTGGE